MHYRIPVLTAALILSSTLLAAAAAPVAFNLSPQNHSGETAKATLTQGKGEVTVVVDTHGGPANPQPIHIHEGTCAKLNPKPAYPLTTVLDGKSVTHVKGVTLAQLQDGHYAINIHHSTTDIKTYYACGNIPKAGSAM